MKELSFWFKKQKRDLPWRDHPTPYAVWISEIMLQQTQVAVVIPYFQRWMKMFPTVDALASADIDQVIKCWEGLGYYSRARNIHTAAKTIQKQFQGSIPDSSDALKKLKGIGPYTVGAILSFAYHRRAAAVDGNVVRVLSRYFCIEEDITKSKTIKKIWQKAEEILPLKEPWVFNEALIELGALVCRKKPECHICPIRSNCLAFQSGKETTLPNKPKREKTIHLKRLVFLAQYQDRFLVGQGKKGEIMEDLYQFPYQNLSTLVEEEFLQGTCLKELLLKNRSFFEDDQPFDWLDTLLFDEGQFFDKVSHSFTKYQVKLFPLLIKIKEKKPFTGYQWLSFKELKEKPFSSGHRRIFQTLEKRQLEL